MLIESNQNPRFKKWKKLLTKKGRKKESLFLVEGMHVVEEALKSGWKVESCITTEQFQLPNEWMQTYPFLKTCTYQLSPSLFEQLSETETPQGVMLTIHMPSYEEQLLQSAQRLLLIDRVQDPGNMGSMIRTADAAGLDAVILNKGSVDPYSGKVIRSTQGSVFHLPVLECDLEELVARLTEQKWIVFGSSLREAVDYRSVQLQKGDRWALIMGNEGQGVSQNLQHSVDKNLKIPIWGKAESLNVATASAVMIYAFQTQYMNQ